MSQIPSLSSEADEIKEVEAFIIETFKQCDKMKTDILEYSSDAKTDLTKFKEHMVNLSEMQKNISGLELAITRLDNYDPDDLGTEPDQILRTFDRIHTSAMEEQFMSDDVERVIAAVDSYINGQSQVSDEDLDNSELMVTSTTESYKDPITKLTITDPVKSITCNHIYERNSILRYLQKKSRCPYPGCTAVMVREDLVDDLETKRKLLITK